MKRKKSWSIQSEETMYTINVERKQIIVTPGEAFETKKLKSQGTFLDREIEIPVGNTIAHLHTNYDGKQIMVVDGKDCETGMKYVTMKMPGWGWVFIVLHVINFFLVIGGAVGGAIGAVLIGVSAKIAAKESEKVLVRVLKCVGIYVLATVIELILAACMAGAMY